MNEVVRQVQGAFGKRAVLRKHRVAQPSDTPRDRVRYLSQLAALNSDFLADVSAIVVPTYASEHLGRLVGAVDAESLLMTSYVTRPRMSFDVLGMRLEDVEQEVTETFLSLLAALDPGSVATAIQVSETD